MNLFYNDLPKYYFGPKLFAKGGGGGSSGKIDYPEHVKVAHKDWLDNTGVDTIETSMVDVMNAALGASPFAAETAYDPTTLITAMDAKLTDLEGVLSPLDEDTDWYNFAIIAKNTIDECIINEASLTAEIAANDAIVNDRINTDTIPRFQAGMRDINAVVSSAFVLGLSNIEAFAQRDKNKFGADLRLDAYRQRNQMIMQGTGQIINLLTQRLSFNQIVAQMTIETKRITYVMKGEEDNTNLEIDEKDARWDLEVFGYGGNLMAAPGGGVVTTGSQKPSKGQSAIGGALAGAAAGAATGAGIPGAVVGSILGGIGGFLA